MRWLRPPGRQSWHPFEIEHDIQKGERLFEKDHGPTTG
jgi:hypothetical protein